MPKPLAESKKIEYVLNEQVRVRTQPELQLSESQLQQLERALIDAVERIQSALQQVKSILEYTTQSDFEEAKLNYPKSFDLLYRHFRINGDMSKNKVIHCLKRMVTRLETMYNALSNDDRTLYLFNTSRNTSDKKYGYVHHEEADRLYINFQLLKPSISLSFISKTILHEASHLYANTEDHAYYHGHEIDSTKLRYFSFFTSYAAAPNLDLPYFRRLNNADSIAYFIMELGDKTDMLMSPETNLLDQTSSRFNFSGMFNGISTIDTGWINRFLP